MDEVDAQTGGRQAVYQPRMGHAQGAEAEEDQQRHGQLRQRDHLVEAVEAQEGEAITEAEAERVIADEQQNQRPGGGKAAPRAAKHARRVRVAAQVGGDAVQEKEHGHLGEGDKAARHHRAQQGKDHEHHRQQALKLAPVQRIEEAIHVRLEKTEDQITGDKPVCEGGHGRQPPPDLADAEGAAHRQRQRREQHGPEQRLHPEARNSARAERAPGEEVSADQHKQAVAQIAAEGAQLKEEGVRGKALIFHQAPRPPGGVVQHHEEHGHNAQKFKVALPLRSARRAVLHW